MDITGFIFELLTLTADLITGGGLVKIATFLLSVIFHLEYFMLCWGDCKTQGFSNVFLKTCSRPAHQTHGPMTEETLSQNTRQPQPPLKAEPVTEACVGGLSAK